MKRIKKILIVVMMMWGLCAAAQTPRITITKFEHNPLSIIGKMDPVRDANGDDCAVIRFFVSDRYFSIDEALRTDTLIGELRTWIPKRTKRLTIRHEGMLPLVGYEIPMLIESKNTYEATVEAVVTTKVEKNKPAINKKPRTSGVYLGAGYNVMSMSGPSFALGLDVSHHQIEIGGVFGLNKTDDIYFYDEEGNLLSAYNYQPLRLQMRYGYDLQLSNFLSLAPQVGIAYNSANGKAVSGIVNTNEKYQKINSISMLGAVRLTMAFSRHFKLQITPEYDFGVSKNLNCKWVGDIDKTVKSWTDGFNLNVGLMVLF